MIPHDYEERVYAGVLGKIIGVYLGRPFENWPYERIVERLGEISHYVNGSPALDQHKRGKPIVQTDDDISGTFTFLRALPDYGNSRDITPAQIGQTWLNYIVEGRSTLWWGGLGATAEHTTYLRLKDGVPAPRSGSAALNGKVLSEQIGGQIFVDGWAMVAPGDPELAAELARRAASVDHDGVAIHAAQVVAAMEAHAFVEGDVDRLIDTALAQIPRDCLIARLIDDVREWHAGEPDWRATRARIEERYGYDGYPGPCHVVPNHALIVLALLYGGGDLHRSLAIVNTSGWDTDCNSGNVGCLLGIRNGLAAFDGGPDWRGPVADRMYVSSADGGRAVTDALTEAHRVVGIGRALAGRPHEAPKGGARFSFALPGSVQGFAADGALQNVALDGRRVLELRLRDGLARALTPTFTPPEAIELTEDLLLAAPSLHQGSYALLASPTLYSGQTIRARLEAGRGNAGPISCRLLTRSYDGRDELTTASGPAVRLEPGRAGVLEWRAPDTGGQPIAQVGVEARADSGTVHLDHLTWGGVPETTLTRPAAGGRMWRRAWVQAVDRFEPCSPEPYRVVHDRGRGLLIQGTREWGDYQVAAPVRPEMVKAAGIAARVQGLRRCYALLLCDDDAVRLVKALDGDAILAEAPFAWEYGATFGLSMRVEGSAIEARVEGGPLLRFDDRERPLTGGAVALVCEEGAMTCDRVSVQPLRRRTTARP